MWATIKEDFRAIDPATWPSECPAADDAAWKFARRGRPDARYSGAQLRETAEDLTAICLRFLTNTRGCRAMLEQRKAVAKELRQLRRINEEFSYL